MLTRAEAAERINDLARQDGIETGERVKRDLAREKLMAQRVSAVIAQFPGAVLKSTNGYVYQVEFLGRVYMLCDQETRLVGDSYYIPANDVEREAIRKLAFYGDSETQEAFGYNEFHINGRFDRCLHEILRYSKTV